MTKELFFDLDCTEQGTINPVSPVGVLFLNARSSLITTKQIYQAAVDAGLHIRFATAAIRDKINHRRD